MTFIIAQIFGIIALILVCIGYFMKDKTKFIISQTISNLFYAGAFFVVGSYVGAGIVAISVIRCIYFYLVEKKVFKFSYLIFSLFIISYIATTIIFFKSPFDIMPLLTCIIFTIAYTIKNLQLIRYVLIVPNSVLVIYNILMTTYASAVLDLIEVIVIIVSIMKFKHLSCNNKNKGLINTIK